MKRFCFSLLLVLTPPLMADGVTYGIVGDDSVLLYTIDAGDLSLTTGTLGDNSVSILQYETPDDPLSITIGNIGDDPISIWDYDEDRGDTDTDRWYDDTQQ